MASCLFVSRNHPLPSCCRLCDLHPTAAPTPRSVPVASPPPPPPTQTWKTRIDHRQHHTRNEQLKEKAIRFDVPGPPLTVSGVPRRQQLPQARACQQTSPPASTEMRHSTTVPSVTKFSPRHASLSNLRFGHESKIRRHDTQCHRLRGRSSDPRTTTTTNPAVSPHLLPERSNLTGATRTHRQRRPLEGRSRKRHRSITAPVRVLSPGGRPHNPPPQPPRPPSGERPASIEGCYGQCPSQCLHFSKKCGCGLAAFGHAGSVGATF